MDEETKKFYIDEPTVVSMFFGELGWLLQRMQAYLRYLKKEVYPDRKFILMMNQQFHIIVHDFVYCTIDLPKEFYALGLETDCYESPPQGSPPGSLTPAYIYSDLIEYFRNFYNIEKAIEIWPPRGPETFWIDHKQFIFAKYTLSGPPVQTDKPIVCVCPRKRERAPQRNVPEYVWYDLVNRLKDAYTVVLCGTPSGSALADYEADGVINLIKESHPDKFAMVVEYMCNSVLVISSQSGLTHVGLLCDRPSYIIGHEKERHADKENRFNTPVSFRYVQDYRAIDAMTILQDIAGFMQAVFACGFFRDNVGNPSEYDTMIEEDQSKLASLTKTEVK